MDDAVLLNAARKLEPDALIAVFDSYAPAIYKYAMRLCHDPLLADDVVGEVFAQLLKQFSNGKGPRENLRSYLYQMAYHAVIDHVRADKHFSDILETTADDLELSVPEEQEVHDVQTQLQQAIKQSLTLDQQHVIILRFFEGFSLQETADIVGKNLNNVKVIQNRAIEKLKHILS